MRTGRISTAAYEIDDEYSESLISRLKRATGHNYEWRDDYEPGSDGLTTVTLERVDTEAAKA